MCCAPLTFVCPTLLPNSDQVCTAAGPAVYNLGEKKGGSALKLYYPLMAVSCSLGSIAILLYMVRKFKTPDHWYPSDLQKRARVDEYLSWQHVNIRGKGSKVFIMKVRYYTPKSKGCECSGPSVCRALWSKYTSQVAGTKLNLELTWLLG